MKYQEHHQPLETDGFGDTANFTIAATGKAFRNLMNGLYSRKIEAAVRELCTNAQDSHIEGGYPHRPFWVQLPTPFKPIFAVRDYGVGMPHAQVMRRYSTLFDSTKDQSNQQTGMLGLGSKSPFAYTDGFTLRCWDGEQRRTYASFLGEGGVPLISLADQRPSTEPRGVEVSFPVKNADVAEFTRAATRVFKGFATPPQGLPAPVLRALEPTVQLHGPGWALVKGDWLAGAKLWALQGCVLYPVELGQLQLSASLAAAYGKMNGVAVLDFEMGSLEFTPGRETLSYTPETVANLQRGLAEFQQGVDAEYEARFADCPTGWQQAVRAEQNNLTGLFGGLFRLTRYAEVVEDVNHAVAHAVRLEEKRSYYRRKPEDDGLHYLVTPDARSRHVRRSIENTLSPFPKKAWGGGGAVVFVHACAGVPAPNKRIAYHLQQTGAAYALVHAPENHSRIDWDKLGNPPVLRLSQLPRPPQAPRKAAQWQRFKVLRDGCWVQPEEDDPLVDGAEVAFAVGSDVVKPHPTRAAGSWEVLYGLHRLEQMHLLESASSAKPPPVLVRLRAGEVYRRWADLPLFQHDPEALVQRLTPAEVMWAVNLRNYDVFMRTHYAMALDNMRARLLEDLESSQWRHGVRPVPVRATNPVLQLGRFVDRYRAVPEDRVSNLNALWQVLPHAAREQLYHRAAQLGLEVLPDYDSTRRRIPTPLLPLRWENLARLLSGGNQRYALSHFIRSIEAGEPQ